MEFEFYIDLSRWAIPLAVSWTRAHVCIRVFCFDLEVWLPAFVKAFPDETPEEALKNLEEFERDNAEFIAEERERILKQLEKEKQND